MVDFGAELKKLRKASCMTQRQLADRLGVTPSVVSYYELSERTLSPDVLRKIAGIFHVSVDSLMGMEHPRSFPLDISGLTDEDLEYLKQTIDILKRKNM